MGQKIDVQAKTLERLLQLATCLAHLLRPLLPFSCAHLPVRPSAFRLPVGAGHARGAAGAARRLHALRAVLRAVPWSQILNELGLQPQTDGLLHCHPSHAKKVDMLLDSPLR